VISTLFLHHSRPDLSRSFSKSGIFVLPTLIPANCLFRKMAPENGAIFLRESWGRSLESTWILNV
jgi:hypothetical protein